MSFYPIYSARYIKCPTTNIEGFLHAEVNFDLTRVTDPGAAGHPGTNAEEITDREIRVRAFGQDASALLALIAAAAANAIVGYRTSGANRKITLKNVVWNNVIGNVVLQPKDAGGKPTAAFGIEGVALWGASDTLATMYVDAADAA